MRGAMLGALAADSLSLATHYEYDAVKIRKFYGAIDAYYAPGEKTGGETHGVGWGARNFHDGNGNGPAKRAGENTDYGDYTLLVAEHLAHAPYSRTFDVDAFLPRWRDALGAWRSWICTMTKETYRQVARGVPAEGLGGMSNAMALRHAGALGYYDDEDALAAAARAMMFTHREATALAGAEFFARVAFRLVHGTAPTPRAAIEAVAAESDDFVRTKVAQALAKVEEAADPASALSREAFVDDVALTSMARLWEVGKSEPIKVGKASPTEGTLPGSVYLIVRYQDDLAAAVSANAGIGGDSASRAVAVGSVLGAHHGVEGIPASLGEGALVEWGNAMALLDQMPLLKGASAGADL